MGSPPLARGTAFFTDEDLKRYGITPACAGNSALWQRPIASDGDHPRLRGEQWMMAARLWRNAGSPPLARGTDLYRPRIPGNPWITPACAGNSGIRAAAFRAFKDHPRLRGEQKSSRIAQRVNWGSPPLARGTVIFSPRHSNGAGITPACAGNSGKVYHSTHGGGDHPRLRGEQNPK